MTNEEAATMNVAHLNGRWLVSFTHFKHDFGLFGKGWSLEAAEGHFIQRVAHILQCGGEGSLMAILSRIVKASVAEAG